MEEAKTSSSVPPPPVRPAVTRAVDPNWVMSRLKDPETLETIRQILQSHGFSISKPSLRLELEVPPGQAALALEIEDLKKLTAPFGTVENIILQNKQKTAAVLVFKDIVSAYLAQQTLHQVAVPSFNAKLIVKWVLSEDDTLPPVDLSSAFLAMESQKTAVPEYKVASTAARAYYPHAPPAAAATMYPEVPPAAGATTAGSGVSKYTCRFDIQIENDKEFQVARKLIGAKGSNMKRIVDQCSQGFACPVQEVIKLRLRGRGSGFKEGPHQQESNEPLHLCISSRYYEKYVMAKHMARDLILEVYEEYKKYCERICKEPPKLEIKLTENVSGNRQRGHTKPMMRPMPMYYNNGPAAGHAVPPTGAAPSYYYEYEAPATMGRAGPYYGQPMNYPPYYRQPTQPTGAAYEHPPYGAYPTVPGYRQPQ